MFGTISMIIGLVADIYSIYEISSKAKENKQNPYSKKSGALGYILLVIGSLAIIIGLMDIFTGFVRNSNLYAGLSNASSYFQSAGSGTSADTDDNSAAAGNTEKKAKKIWIEDMPVFAYQEGVFNNKYEYKRALTINTGEELKHSLLFTINAGIRSSHSQHLDYYLNGNYSGFNATLAWTQECIAYNSSYDLSILFDDEVVQEYHMKSGFIPEKIDLDVSSVKIMSIRIDYLEGINHWECPQCAFGEAYFTTKP